MNKFLLLLIAAFLFIYNSSNSQTILKLGDLAILGVNANVGGTNGSGDEISFVCFKDITTGTQLQLTDNGYSSCTAGRWSVAEGGATFTRTGGTIPAGTVITLRTAPVTFLNPDNAWTVADLVPGLVTANFQASVGFGGINLNAGGDQIYFGQNGTWTNKGGSCIAGRSEGDFPGKNGTILFGFSTGGTWKSGQANTANSGLYSGLNCFSSSLSGKSDFSKYTGPLTAATHLVWLSRLTNQSNWSNYASSAAYATALPLLSALVITIDSGGNIPAPIWTSPTSAICASDSSFDLNTLVTGTAGGTWSGTGTSSTGVFNATGLNGSYNIIYSINYISNGNSCSIHKSDSIIVQAKTKPSFTQIPSICMGDTFNLPNTSNNGISGTWSPAINNTKTTTYTFTPSTGVCVDTATMKVFVSSIIVPIFNQISPVCSDSSFVLPTISLNGISGTWSPAVNNRTTTTYTFTPSTGQCASTTTMTVIIKQSPYPIFNPISPICVGGSFSLPNISLNGIRGIWVPNINNTKTTTYIFIPNPNQCALSRTLTVVVNTGIVPTFASIAPICTGGSFVLPTSSTNGITGTWTPTIDNSKTTTYTFTPNAGQCATTTTITVNVNKTVSSTTIFRICPNALPYTWNGLTFTTGGTQTKTGLVNSQGCDSSATLILKIDTIATTNAVNISGCDSVVYKSKTYTVSTMVRDTVKSILGCDSVYNVATITVNPKPVVGAISGPSVICINSGFAMFSDTSKYGTWTTSNGAIILLNTAGLAVPIAVGDATIFYTITNSFGCANSASLNVQVLPNVNPSVTVTPSTNNICSGTVVLFSANTSNLGTTTIYTWKKNSKTVGTNSANYNDASLANGDSITCSINTTGVSCISTNTVTSNLVLIVVKGNISGTVSHPTLGRIKRVNMKSSFTNDSTLTNNGEYVFSCVPNGSSTTIRPSKNNDSSKLNGITVIDALLVQSHVLNKMPLNSPYKIIAADVNKSGDVSAVDILFIKRLILGIDTTFPGNRLWAFVDSAYKFVNAKIPFPYKDSIRITNLKSNQTSQNFIGMKLGDVNYDWDAATLGTTRTTTQPVELVYQDAATHTDELRIPIKVNHFQSILGMQYTMNYNQSAWQLTGVENNRLNMDYGTAHLSEGKVSFLWTDEKLVAQTLADSTELLTLVFKKIGNQPEAQLRLSSDVTVIEAWDAAYQRHDVVLKAANKPTDQFIAHESYTVSPNPTDGKVVLQLNLSTAKPLQVVLTDANGRMVYQQKINATKGSSRVALDFKKDQPLTAGNYYLQVNGLEGENTQKLLVK